VASRHLTGKIPKPLIERDFLVSARIKNEKRPRAMESIWIVKVRVEIQYFIVS
jgi:hypothetical protein